MAKVGEAGERYGFNFGQQTVANFVSEMLELAIPPLHAPPPCDLDKSLRENGTTATCELGLEEHSLANGFAAAPLTGLSASLDEGLSGGRMMCGCVDCATTAGCELRTRRPAFATEVAVATHVSSAGAVGSAVESAVGRVVAAEKVAAEKVSTPAIGRGVIGRPSGDGVASAPLGTCVLDIPKRMVAGSGPADGVRSYICALLCQHNKPYTRDTPASGVALPTLGMESLRLQGGGVWLRHLRCERIKPVRT